MIKNLLNGRFYIGASNCVYQRILNHKSELNRGIGTNKALQKDWQEYGVDAFAFMTLEVCPKGLIKEKEDEWLRKAKVAESELAYNKSYRAYIY
ncbi:GIY-YIG nuclease family protein [Pseudalkalibacillus hwajinpoensis]|uniref:GIY-YIG nuclease family protein n=1 Tax=Guptibacillus hwajinpoensis TaxID=208199 RepID=UPI00325AE0E7